MDREALKAGARKILLGNLRQGRADWNGEGVHLCVPGAA